MRHLRLRKPDVLRGRATLRTTRGAAARGPEPEGERRHRREEGEREVVVVVAAVVVGKGLLSNR